MWPTLSSQYDKYKPFCCLELSSWIENFNSQTPNHSKIVAQYIAYVIMLNAVGGPVKEFLQMGGLEKQNA